MAKFGQKFVGPFKVLEVVNNKLIIDTEGEMTTINLDYDRVESSRMSSGESQLP